MSDPIAQVIQLPARCWECGRKATKRSPDSEAFGCASCFPHWPDSPPEAAPVPPLSDDQPRVGLGEIYLCPRCKVPHLRTPPTQEPAADMTEPEPEQAEAEESA